MILPVRALAALAVAMLFAGCAALAPEGAAPPAASFDILGRVLVSGDGRAFSSGVRWRHESAEDEIWLLSPIGQTLAHIAAEPAGATLTGADQKVYQARTVEGLTESAFGWTLPLAHLQHWVQGLVVPGGPAAEISRDVRGRLVRLAQDGWTVRYVYGDADGESLLPRRLDLDRDGRQIRLVIDDWRSRVTQ